MPAPATAMIDKVARNLGMLGISYTRNGDVLVAAGLTLSLVEASVQSPMGGVNGNASPFLGIGGSAMPKTWKIKGEAGQNTIAAIFTGADELKIFSLLAHMANDIVVEAGDTTTELARIPGHQDVQFLGQ